MGYSEKVQPAPVTWDDLRRETDWMNKRIEDQRKKIRAIVALLIEHKVVSEEMARLLFEETVIPEETKMKNILEWYLKKGEE